MPCRVIKGASRRVWKTISERTRSLWSLTKNTMNETHIYTNGFGYMVKRQRVHEVAEWFHASPGLDQTGLTCVGLSAAWHTHLGRDHPSVIQWVHDGKRGDELRDSLMTLGMFEATFKAFLEHMHAMAKHLGIFGDALHCQRIPSGAPAPLLGTW